MQFGIYLLPFAFAFITSAHAGSLPQRPVNRIAISRRSLRHGSPVQSSGSIRIFDYKVAHSELNGVLSKYANAHRILEGIDLSPALNVSLYYPINKLQSLAVEQDTTYDTTPPADPPLPVPVVAIPTGTGVMPLTDAMSGTLDLLYYGPLDFGSNAQSMTVDIDTGSADLWVPTKCPECSNSQFDSEASVSFVDSGSNFTITYGSGEVSGTIASDTVSLGSSTLTVSNQAFGAITQVSDDFNSEPNDGLIGMAFSSIASSRQKTFFENLIVEKKLAAPIFSVHLARNQASGSELCFGCLDSTKTIGPVTWIPVKSKTYWSVEMDAIVYDQTQILQTQLTAAIDTGTTLVYVPASVAASFYHLIPQAKPAPQYGPEFYTFPCSTTSDISLSFSGHHFSINMYDFNLGRTSVGSADCVGGILSLGEGFQANLAIIGDEFLKSWYSTFDYQGHARVGFSPSINNRT